MKQSLTELAEILRAVDAGAEWECEYPEFGWARELDQSPKMLLQLAGYGWAIRLKPGQSPDPHPNKAEVEEGIAQGREWQFRHKNSPSEHWRNGVFPHPAWFANVEYRLAPEPEYVSLGPEDVPPGSVFGLNGRAKNTWHGLIGVYSSTIALETTRRDYTYGDLLIDGWQINRSLPLTGKWDANAWEPCRKLKGGSDE